MIYNVSKKTSLYPPFYFLNKFVKNKSILIIFGTYYPEEAVFVDVYY